MYYRDGALKWHKLGDVWNSTARSKWVELANRDGDAGSGSTAINIDGLLRMYLVAKASEQQMGIQHALSVRSIADSQTHATSLGLVFGNMLPGELSSRHVAMYLKKRTRKGTTVPAPTRANREISTLSSAFSWAMGQGLVNTNPCYGVRRNPESSDTHAPTEEEVRAVQSVASDKWKNIIQLALLTGQRAPELRELKWVDVLDSGIYFRPTKTAARTNAAVVIEFATDDVGDVLDTCDLHRCMEWFRKDQRHPTPWVIPTRNGQPYTARGFKSMFCRLMDKALTKGVLSTRFQFKQIRAANATIEDEQGGSAQKRLTHATGKQTAVYIRGRRPARVKPLKLSANNEPKQNAA